MVEATRAVAAVVWTVVAWTAEATRVVVVATQGAAVAMRVVAMEAVSMAVDKAVGRVNLALDKAAM